MDTFLVAEVYLFISFDCSSFQINIWTLKMTYDMSSIPTQTINKLHY